MKISAAYSVLYCVYEEHAQFLLLQLLKIV